MGFYLQGPFVGYICCDSWTSILQNGELGMGLLTVKSIANDRFSPFIAILETNPTLLSWLLTYWLNQ